MASIVAFSWASSQQGDNLVYKQGQGTLFLLGNNTDQENCCLLRARQASQCGSCYHDYRLVAQPLDFAFAGNCLTLTVFIVVFLSWVRVCSSWAPYDCVPNIVSLTVPHSLTASRFGSFMQMLAHDGLNVELRKRQVQWQLREL